MTDPWLPLEEEAHRQWADAADWVRGGEAGRRFRQDVADAFDDTRSWVDPSGYRLSDRVWKARATDRAAIDGILKQMVARGQSSIEAAKAVEGYLLPTARQTTTMPRGGRGMYAARRLTRTEMTRAYGAATVQAAAVNPFVAGVKWNLSGRHPEADGCDPNAGEDRYGLGPGTYPPQDVPRYPAHPMCICTLSPATVDSDAALDAIIGEMRAARGEGAAMEVAFPLIAGPEDKTDVPTDPAAIKAEHDALAARLGELLPDTTVDLSYLLSSPESVANLRSVVRGIRDSLADDPTLKDRLRYVGTKSPASKVANVKKTAADLAAKIPAFHDPKEGTLYLNDFLMAQDEKSVIALRPKTVYESVLAQFGATAPAKPTRKPAAVPPPEAEAPSTPAKKPAKKPAGNPEDRTDEIESPEDIAAELAVLNTRVRSLMEAARKTAGVENDLTVRIDDNVPATPLALANMRLVVRQLRDLSEAFPTEAAAIRTFETLATDDTWLGQFGSKGIGSPDTFLRLNASGFTEPFDGKPLTPKDWESAGYETPWTVSRFKQMAYESIAETIIHEFGHAIDHVHQVGEYAEGKYLESQISEYARTVGAEHVAETFAYMWMYPDTFKDRKAGPPVSDADRETMDLIRSLTSGEMYTGTTPKATKTWFPKKGAKVDMTTDADFVEETPEPTTAKKAPKVSALMRDPDESPAQTSARLLAAGYDPAWGRHDPERKAWEAAFNDEQKAVDAEVFAALSPEQQAIIRDYKGSVYKKVNQALRGQGVDPDDPLSAHFSPAVLRSDGNRTFRQFADDLDAALWASSAVRDAVIFRSTDSARVEDIYGKTRPGDVVTEAGYFSAATSWSGVDGSVEWEVRIPKGTPGMQIDVAGNNVNEMEFLTPRGLTYRVLSNTVTGGKRKIVAEALPYAARQPGEQTDAAMPTGASSIRAEQRRLQDELSTLLGGTTVEFTGIEATQEAVEGLRGVVKGLKESNDLFPNAMSRVTYIGTMDGTTRSPKGKAADHGAYWDTEEKALYINPETISGKWFRTRNPQADTPDGVPWSLSRNAEDTMIHEVAHVVDDWLTNASGSLDQIKVAARTMDVIERNYKASGLSQYARSASWEGLAEAYLYLRNNPNAVNDLSLSRGDREMLQAVSDLVDEYGSGGRSAGITAPSASKSATTNKVAALMPEPDRGGREWIGR